MRDNHFAFMGERLKISRQQNIPSWRESIVRPADRLRESCLNFLTEFWAIVNSSSFAPRLNQNTLPRISNACSRDVAVVGSEVDCEAFFLEAIEQILQMPL